ncbi:MAG: hypothetical protein RR655_00335 [Raoultibacter sp.]
MDKEIRVHPRVHERHPEIDESDVKHAWKSAVKWVRRAEKSSEEYVVIGVDGKGRILEMVAVETDENSWFVYHAMTPPSHSTFAEVGLQQIRK